ncbi:class I SAM-dependent methyltransferase [Jannaschia donghaensis]|uniref:Methyltransferase domain protein n=1 Tax=Jannaschia donghaensis TaxID=420998 RepID=A0A0M6YLI1_9RHOB|nr:class I SAM-dependent methyltransferase [Jannaschia donghaensis]CTQ50515.1 Methyltransferase domain protein [Jannaschia donghaensis]
MDLFGNALRDRQAGHHGRLLTIRRDDDHVDAHDPGLYFSSEPFPHEAELLRQAEGPVLDVGCGAGRTLLWLQGRGIAATGIDLSPGAVAVARARGCADVRLGDAMDPASDALKDGRFRTITLLGNNLGIGGTFEGAATLLRRLAGVTAPGGCLLVTGLDIARTEVPHHLAYHRRNRDRGRPIGEIEMRFEYQGAVGEWVPWFHPEPVELQRLPMATGWVVERIGPAAGPFWAAVLRLER